MIHAIFIEFDAVSNTMASELYNVLYSERVSGVHADLYSHSSLAVSLKFFFFFFLLYP